VTGRQTYQLEVLCVCLRADELDMVNSGYLLNHPFNECAHDFGFFEAYLKNFLVRDDRLRRVLDDLPFELNETQEAVNRLF